MSVPPDMTSKAREFLNKNYTKLKIGDAFSVIYILEPRSINGIARIEDIPRYGNDEEYGVRKNYTRLDNNKDFSGFVKIPRNQITEAWYTNYGLMKSNPLTKRFTGGRKLTKRIKRKIKKVKK